MLPRVQAIRYVTPLREGGSLPAVMEADDLGTYVVKFRGAGQGRKALIAEIISGWPGPGVRAAVPDLVTVDLDPALAPGEPDQEIQDLLRASGGLNLGVDFLPGALDFETGAATVEPALAGRIMWFDALIGNADRSWRNPNMLLWHGSLYLIDHGATLTFQHRWSSAAASRRSARMTSPSTRCSAAARWSRTADAELAPRLTTDVLARRSRRYRRSGSPESRASTVSSSCATPTSPSCSADSRPGPAWLPPSRPPPGPGWRQVRPPTGLDAGGRPPGSRAQRADDRAADDRQPHPFEYAVVRVVPRVDRGEAINAGVLLYCRPLGTCGPGRAGRRPAAGAGSGRRCEGDRAGARGDRPGLRAGSRRLGRRACRTSAAGSAG